MSATADEPLIAPEPAPWLLVWTLVSAAFALLNLAPFAAASVAGPMAGAIITALRIPAWIAVSWQTSRHLRPEWPAWRTALTGLATFGAAFAVSIIVNGRMLETVIFGGLVVLLWLVALLQATADGADPMLRYWSYALVALFIGVAVLFLVSAPAIYKADAVYSQYYRLMRSIAAAVAGALVFTVMHRRRASSG